MRRSSVFAAVWSSVAALSALLALAPALTAGQAAPAAASRPSKLLTPAALTAKAPALFKAKFDTSKGPFVIEVHRDWAPLGADRFYNMVTNGFFSGVRFFRVIPNFMAQFGINGNPAVTAAWNKVDLKDDPPNKQSNQRAFVTYGTTGRPDSRGTQIFINYKDNSFLDAAGLHSVRPGRRRHGRRRHAERGVRQRAAERAGTHFGGGQQVPPRAVPEARLRQDGHGRQVNANLVIWSFGHLITHWVID